MQIHATRAVRETLAARLGLTGILEAFCGVDWHEPPLADFAPLTGIDGREGSLVYRAIELPGGPPIFVSGKHLKGGHSVAYQILDCNTGGRLLVAPDVGGFTDALSEAILESDAVLFDGTFWSADELLRVKTSAPTAAAMGHVTIRDESLALLSRLPAKHKIYIHINNTNPVLSPDSQEQAAVAVAGVVVGCDGLEFEL